MISGPAMWKKCASLSLATASRQPGLAGAGRAVEQHALGRIDAEPLEQFGVAQRQLDHFAQRIDRLAHPAEIVIGDVGAALARLFGIFGKQFDHGVRRRCGRCPRGVADTIVSRTSCSAKAGALSIWRIWSGMSALTR